MDLIVALDQGSSSSRAIAFDLKGGVVARSQAPIRPQHPKEGWVEFDPEELFRSQTETLESVVRALPKGASVGAAGLACQRSTVVFWDAKTGKAALPALSWQDRRAAAQCEPLAKKAEDIHVRTGLLLNPFYSLPKILWAFEEYPKLRTLLDAGRLRVGPVSSFLIWRWTNGQSFVVDPTMAQRMLLFNIAKMEWDAGLLKIAGLSREALPDVKPSAGLEVEIPAAGRKVALRATLGDQQSAALGLGVTDAGGTAANYGTGAFLLHNIGAKRKHVQGLLTSVAEHRRAHEPRFLLEGTVNAAGTGVDFLRARLGLAVPEAELGELYGRSTHRVLALLSLGGLGAPRWDTKVQSGFFGLRQSTGPADLVRGALDSVAFLISDIADAITGAGQKIESVRVSGGLAWIDGLMQTQADLLQVPLTRLKEHERTALGAAALAADAAGVPFSVPQETDKLFKPRIPPTQATHLKDCWRTFVEGFQSLSRDPKVFESLLNWNEQFES